jgi:serine phosphatase RsbU (regulator of sigma subunit)
MIFYNLFLYFSIRDVNYIYYVLYVFAQLFFQVSYLGFGYEYIWPESPYLNNMFLPLSSSFAIITPLLFANKFLNIKRYSDALHAIYYFFVLLLVIGIGALFLNYVKTSFVIINVTVLLAILLLIVSSIIVIIKGYEPAKYFLLAWIILLLTTVVFVLKNSGIIAPNAVTTYSVHIGISFEVLLLSFALGNRINIIRREKDKAKEDIIEIHKTYSSSLEKTVQERTCELEKERNKLKEKNEIMEHEITLARKIQNQLIPLSNPTSFIYSLYKPMEEVGGDFFDFIEFSDGKIGIFISDVSGHGVPAAFITSMIKTTILQSGNRKENPAELLHYINEVLQNQTGGNFITAFYGIYEQKTRNMRFSNAGHYQPYVITDSTVTQLLGGKNTAIAMFPNNFLAKNNKHYTNHEETLPPDSKLLLFTDGLIETRPLNDESLFFEYSGMENIFIENKHLPCDRFIDALYNRLVQFRGSESFDDDVCIICVDVK